MCFFVYFSQQLKVTLHVCVCGCCSCFSSEICTLNRAPSAATLNGKHQTFTARCIPDKPVLTDKAEQLWPTTELHNTNANINL